MAHTVTINDTNNALSQYCNRFSAQIHQTVKQSLEFERELPFQPCDYAYTGQEGEVGDTLQPYQSAFTPVNTETFDGITSFLQIGKIDLLFDAIQLEKYYSKWKCDWFEAGKDPAVWSYPRYIIDNFVITKATEELNTASWSGVRVAPTPGTAGAPIEAFDGFKKGIADMITASRLTPTNTGALVASTMVAQVRDHHNQIPEPYRYMQGITFCSKTIAQQYADDYASKFPSRKVTEDEPDRMYVRVDHYNKTLVGVTAMEGSDRLITVFNSRPSMIIGTRDGFPRYFDFRFEVEDRKVKAFCELYRFFSFETTKHMFVNEQV